jgi:SAM-dependent methyltransferase
MEPWLEVSLARTVIAWVHRCTRCGFRQIRPRLGGARLAALYPTEYFDTRSGIGYRDYARQCHRLQRDAYFLTKQFRPIAPAGPVLEVGCALGFLLAGLAKAGWEVEGIDVSPFAAYYAQTRFGLRVSCATLEAKAFPGEHFAIVIQKDVLEHVSDPRRHLLETHRILRRGGYLSVITPNGEANLRPLNRLAHEAARDERRGVPLLDQGHLSFFAVRHLMTLVSECGFECLRARVIGVRRGARALGMLPGQRRFMTEIERERADHLSREQPSDRSSEREDRYRAVAEPIDEAIEAWRSRVKQWVPYYYLHRLFKQLDTLPAQTEIGYDFDLLLRKK